MPELPEVETIKNTLIAILKDRTILDVQILRKSIVENEINDFITILKNSKIVDIQRRGKYLIFFLNNDYVFISHLRMEGKYYELDENEKNSKYARVIFYLDNHKKICYDDSRTFGKMFVSHKDHYLEHKCFQKLGIEPFDVKDINEIYEKAKKMNCPIKSGLLSQTLFVGLGNIYVDEVLFASNIHPLTPTNKINKKQWEDIVNNTKLILKEAIAKGGSTIKSYHPGKDISGNFQNNLLVYGRKSKKCVVCHTFLRFIKVNGRGTTYCPTCQKKTNPPLKIAIVGKIASGKSTVLSLFKKENYLAISCDDIVHDLYQDKDVQEALIQKFHLDRNINFIDSLRNHLFNNPSSLLQVERKIHPLVKKQLIRSFEQSRSPLLVAEVPLLFKAKMQDMFDIIIGVDISDKNQNDRLNIRDKNKSEFLKKINEANCLYEQNKNYLDFIIDNNDDAETLENKTKEIIYTILDRLN